MALLDVLDPRAIYTDGDVVFFLAGHGAGVAPDATMLIDEKPVAHSKPFESEKLQIRTASFTSDSREKRERSIDLKNKIAKTKIKNLKNQLLRVGNAGGMICFTVLPAQSRLAQLSQARLAPSSMRAERSWPVADHATTTPPSIRIFIPTSIADWNP